MTRPPDVVFDDPYRNPEGEVLRDGLRRSNVLQGRIDALKPGDWVMTESFNIYPVQSVSDRHVIGYGGELMCELSDIIEVRCSS